MTHKDAASVDHYVRKGLKASGELREQVAKTLTLGTGEYERELEVCLGERLRFQKNDWETFVKTGQAEHVHDRIELIDVLTNTEEPHRTVWTKFLRLLPDGGFQLAFSNQQQHGIWMPFVQSGKHFQQEAVYYNSKQKT